MQTVSEAEPLQHSFVKECKKDENWKEDQAFLDILLLWCLNYFLYFILLESRIIIDVWLLVSCIATSNIVMLLK